MLKKIKINKEKRKKIIFETIDKDKADIFYCKACDIFYVINKINEHKECHRCNNIGEPFEKEI